MYSTLRSYDGFSTLPWLDFHSIRDDDAQKGSSTTDGAEINTEFETFQYSKDDWAPNTYWNDRFYMINLANKSLHLADSLHLTDPASLRNIGEAYFFRAYSYFDLVRTYGEVPLIDFYYTTATAGNKPKSNVNAIFALIDADLTKATQYLPLNWKSGTGTNLFPGRLTSGAAKTLWAQAYLFRSNWARVVALCNEVIASGEYKLLPNFVDIWKDGLNGAGKNSDESIFEMQASIGANGTNYYGKQWQCQNVRQGGASTDWNLGWGWNTPTDNLVNAWDNTDPRKAATILYSGQFDGGPAKGGYGATLPPYAPGSGLDQKYWNKKVYSDPQMRQYTGEIGPSGGADWINHRLFRYADVILMLAEAANETSDGAVAANLERSGTGQVAIWSTRTILPYIPYTIQAAMRTAKE
jgi:hypothetical protein